MRDDLRTAWEEGLERARAFEPGDDPEPVLETLGLLVVLELTGDLATLGREERALVRDRGRRALLGGAPDDVDPEDWQLARDLARAGLSLLEGRPAEGPAQGLHPPDGQLIQMLRGEPDGLSAGLCAGHVLDCDQCRAAVRVLDQSRGAVVATLAVAAAAAEEMRPPAEGTLLSQIEDPRAEVLLFAEDGGRQLAVYAAESAPVRVVGEGVTTEQMLSGYWLGRVAPGAERLALRLHVGDRTADLEIDLTAR